MLTLELAQELVEPAVKPTRAEGAHKIGHWRCTQMDLQQPPTQKERWCRRVPPNKVAAWSSIKTKMLF